MNRLFIKICGITRLDDALSAGEAGVDAVGFNFYPASKRFITVAQAAAIAREIPLNLLKVGVFVNPDRKEVLKAIEGLDLGAIQFSGNESPSDVAGYSLPVFKVIHVKNSSSIEEAKLFSADAFLLDTYRDGEFGGTGESFDWKIGRKANALGKIILAGGLTPDNVSDAVEEAMPYGVDVSSGVEISPGIKDRNKIERFVKKARTAAEHQDYGTHGK